MIRKLTPLLVLLAACPAKTDDTRVRVGVDESLKEVGLPAFLQAAYEEATKERLELIYATTPELAKAAANGDLDLVLGIDGPALDRLGAEGIAKRAEPFAHEELILIGPFEDYLGRHGQAAGAELLKNIARATYRYLKARPGSAEREIHDHLFVEGNDRAEPGSFFETDLEGAAFAREAIERKAFALVKRSSLMMAAQEGKVPHRVYKESDPDLVLRLVIAEIHSAKTKRPAHPGFVDYVLGEEGSRIVATFGADRFGVPVFGAGSPAQGEGAKLPTLQPAQ